MSQQSQQVFSGRYEIVRHIARGGMAEVYLAHDLMLDRRVALKVLFPELSTDRSFVERFRREAQNAANLSHPNIVAVYDWGEEDGTYFIVMEYVEGRTLSQILRTEGPLLPDRAAEIATDVAGALAFAHHNGVIHRDVKPGNVLISASGQVKVTDFGIARAAGTDQDLTQTGSVMGTATYFSPEQAQGLHVDARSDVYSLGVMLYEMVAGRPPFQGDNAMAIAYKHVREQPVAPRQVNADVPPQLDAIVQQAMAKNPNDRYTSADELRADLLRFREGRRVMANPTVAAAPADATRAVSAVDATQAVGRTAVAPPLPPHRRTGAFVALLIVLLALLGGLIYLFAREAGLVGGSGSSPSKVTMPNVVGATAEDAANQLKSAGLEVQQDSQANDTQQPGHVYDQDPKPGAKVDKGATVTIHVAAAPEPVKVPRVVGKSVTDAQDILDSVGLSSTVKRVNDQSAPKDQVISANPPEGSAVNKGSAVELTVSDGKPQVAVPDVTGDDAADAANRLGQAGFKTKTATEASPTVAAGKVIRTDPAANAKIDQGSTVTLVVSTGPQQVTVPNVIGKSPADAKAAVEAAGLVFSGSPSNASPNATATRQTPGSGQTVDAGATVSVMFTEPATTTTSSTTSSTLLFGGSTTTRP